MAEDEKIPEIDIKARQTSRHTRVTVDVPTSNTQAEREAARKKQEEQEEGDSPTVAGYTLGELIKAPLEPPDEKTVGKRSPKTE